jgi:hypothetical protein
VGKKVSATAEVAGTWLKKQWYRKDPSRMKWQSASARCQMKKKRTVAVVLAGRTARELR